MFGIGKGFFGGLLALFIFSIIVFFVIYLLVPEVSIKFFGISVNSDEYVEAALEDSLSDLDLPEGMLSDLLDVLSSEDVQNAVGSSADKLISYIQSEEFRSDVQGFVDSGASTVQELSGRIKSELAAEAGE